MRKPSYNRGKGRGLAWIREHVSYQGDECLIWPMGRDRYGYGQVGINGKVRRAHRVMCELAKGPPPSPEHEAAHSCGRGHDACMNQKHISWKTGAENKLDKREHGTAGWHDGRNGRRRVLTAEDVAKIRRLIGSTRVVDLATRFGVSRATIREIRDGKTWRPDAQRQLSPREVLAVRDGLSTGRTVRELSKQYRVGINVVYRIRDGKTYRHVVEPSSSWGG